MRLDDLERKQINEAAQALALPVIGLVSPAAANVMLNALGLGATALAAYYTSKEIDKLKVNYSGAWENISNALAQTAEQIEKGALIANPMIMTAIMLNTIKSCFVVFLFITIPFYPITNSNTYIIAGIIAESHYTSWLNVTNC